MSKHTAGPWVFGILSWGDGAIQEIEEKPFDYSGPGYYDNPSIMDKNGNEIVGCGEYDVFSSPENTRLMVAAPDLLEALEALLAGYESMMHSEFDYPNDLWSADGRGDAEALNAIKSIAKARGEA